MKFINITFVIILFFAWNSCLGTPLDDYVNAPDLSFSWRRLQTYPYSTYTLYVLNMTSQRWFDGKVLLL